MLSQKEQTKKSKKKIFYNFPIQFKVYQFTINWYRFVICHPLLLPRTISYVKRLPSEKTSPPNFSFSSLVKIRGHMLHGKLTENMSRTIRLRAEVFYYWTVKEVLAQPFDFPLSVFFFAILRLSTQASNCRRNSRSKPIAASAIWFKMGLHVFNFSQLAQVIAAWFCDFNFARAIVGKLKYLHICFQ